MRKKTQRIFAGVLAVFVSIAMIGGGIIGLFFGDDNQIAGSQAAAQAANAAAEYQSQKESVAALAKQAEIDPDNMYLLKALAEGYFQAGVVAQYVAVDEMQENFRRAAEVYQKILTKEDDADIRLNLALAADGGGDDALTERTYQEILAQNPEHFGALVRYGAFLVNNKDDYTGAIEQLQKALPLAQDDSEKEQIQAFISRLEQELDGILADPVVE